MLRGRVFVGLALWFTAYSVAQSAFIFQFVPLLTTWGVETAAILTSVAIIGPMQVVGRIVLMCFSARLETREIGMAVIGAPPGRPSWHCFSSRRRSSRWVWSRPSTAREMAS